MILTTYSARFGHTPHPYGGELHGGARRGHAHASRGADGARGGGRRGAHARAAGQGPGVLRTPRQESRGSQPGTDVTSHHVI